MKRLCILIGVALLLISVSAVAEISILIDFSTLIKDATLGDNQKPTENADTLVDFSSVAGSTFDEETKAKMKTSLSLDNWDVILASSARTVQNQAKSMTKDSVTSETARPFQGEEMANMHVMGIRVHFPMPSFNSYAIIQPPFEIPAYAIKTELQGDKIVEIEGDLGTKFDGKGVVRNVGVLKSVEVTVFGSNFPNGFGIILKDQNGKEQHIFMDYLQFDGWRKLEWKNPNYITEVRNREVKKYPLYPKSEPFRKLTGIIVYRDAMQEGGDIIVYVKDIKLTYDKAILEPVRDINHEAIWGILKDRLEARRQAELRRVGNKQVERYLEGLKMHKETSD
jgi:hypothetical protein